MSTTTPAPAKSNKFQIFDSLIALVLWGVGIFLVGLATVIGYNAGEFTLSFWLGVIIPLSIGIALFILWVSHSMAFSMTKKWPGFLLGAADLVAALVGIPLLMLLPGASFQPDKFGWGIVATACLTAFYVLIKLYAWLSRKLKAKLDASTDPSTTPSTTATP